FGIGLFVVLSFGFDLFTGKVGYAVENKPSYLGELGIIWLGNFAGAVISALLITQTRISTISDKASELCNIKLGDNITSVFILSFFCGILMFVAADGYKTIQNPVGQILAIFLPVVVFILSGFEHCVANMYFFTIADLWSVKAFGYLIIMSLGNSIGGILIPLLRKGFVSRA
ncbi:MAG TPA: formate/nitrite transporter, partial [Ruminococcus sp.]|nr:formate/nitrite transporter [Ruminococcus sp.]